MLSHSLGDGGFIDHHRTHRQSASCITIWRILLHPWYCTLSHATPSHIVRFCEAGTPPWLWHTTYSDPEAVLSLVFVLDTHSLKSSGFIGKKMHCEGFSAGLYFYFYLFYFTLLCTHDLSFTHACTPQTSATDSFISICRQNPRSNHIRPLEVHLQTFSHVIVELSCYTFCLSSCVSSAENVKS